MAQDEWEDIDEWEDVSSEPVAPAGPKISPLETAALSAGSGATLGFLDELAAAGGSLVDVARRSDKSLSDLPELYQRNKADFREAMAASSAQNPNTAIGTEIAGSIVPSLLVPGSGSTLGARLGVAAGLGGVSGAGQSEADNMPELSADIVQGAALGGIFQGGGELVGKALGKGVDAVARSRALQSLGGKLEGTAEDLAARAIGAERGSIRALGPDKVKQAARYALDEGIVSPRLNTEEMLAKNVAAQKAAGEGMEKVYNTIDQRVLSEFNPLDVATKVESELGGFWRSPLNKASTNQLENTLEAITARGAKNIPLQEAQALKQELGKAANWKNNVVVTDKENIARQAYGIVSGAIDEATEKGAKRIEAEGLPELLKASKQKYASSMSAEKLLENKFAREQGNKLFGLTDTIAGAGGLTMGGPMAMALVAGKKVADRYLMSSSAVGADKVSKLLKQAPQRLGKYAPVLEKAAARSPHSLAVTNYLMSKSDPEYQKTIKALDDEEQE